jgi:hypothetical protein
MAEQSPYFFNKGANYNITINWIRHGESCSNLATDGHQDRYPTDKKPDIGYGITANKFETDNKAGVHNVTIDQIKNPQIKNPDDDDDGFEALDGLIAEDDDNMAEKTWADWFTKTLSKLKGTFMYEPNLSYIGMSHAINLGANFFSNPTHNNPANIYISSALTRTITTALLALRFVPNAVIYVVPYINETGNAAQQFGVDAQNTGVESSILKKRILFIKKWLDQNWITRFDDIEIINFLITIYEIIDPKIPTAKEIKLKITEILTCRRYVGCRKDKYAALQNYVVELLNMEDLNTYLLQTDETRAQYTLVTNFITKAKEIFTNLRKFKYGPTVNFEIYDYYEKLRLQLHYKDVIPDTTISNIDFFFTDVLKIIYRDIKFTKDSTIYPKNLQKLEDSPREDITIYAFVHGNLIRHIWKKFRDETDDGQSYETVKHELEIMMNTAVISDTIKLKRDSHIILRHRFSIIHLPEKIRSTYYNFEKYHPSVCRLQSIKGIINFPLSSISSDSTFKERYPPDENSKFFYDDIKPDTPHLPLVIDGYERKYLKYKQKYLDLKKHNL